MMEWKAKAESLSEEIDSQKVEKGRREKDFINLKEWAMNGLWY